MTEIELLVLLLLAAVVLAGVARWLRWPYPILLVLGGLVISLQDGVPHFALPPEVVLSLFLPPLLYAAAYVTHWPTFRKYLRSITMLAFGLTVFTAGAVALVAHEFLGMGWAPAAVLGAIVSPPDAVAAVAITRRVKIPRAVAAVLEGESLVNDAAALALYRVGVAAVVTGTFEPGPAAGLFALVGFGGLAWGLVCGWLVVRAHTWLNDTGVGDAKIVIAFTLLTPYLIYLPAERLHVSGVLAVVTAGLWVGTRSAKLFPPELAVEARSVWEMVEFLLNSFIFIVIGFQLPMIHEGLLANYTVGGLARAAALVTAAVVGARLVWMYPGAYLPRYTDRWLGGRHVVMPTARAVAVVGWTGMRGVVSLATALALPAATATGEAFPHRDLIVFLTFWVIVGTLVGQGMTLPLVIRALGVDREYDPDELRKTRGEVRVLPR